MCKTPFSIGNQLFREKKYNEAISLYKESLKKHGFSYCYENLAMAYYRINELKEARESLKNALEASTEEGRRELLRLNPIFNFLKVDHKTQTVRQKFNFPVNDLIGKLWGGFSQRAKQDLIERLTYDNTTNQDKVRIASILARWYAANNEWNESIVFLKKIREFDEKGYRGKKNKLLLIEGYLHTKQYTRAKEIIDYVLDQRVDGDFLCALSNLIDSEQPLNASELRLETLNKIYIKADLAPLKLINEIKGLIFGNICYNLTDKQIKNDPKVSILVPVYNAEKFIDVAILSLLNQTWNNIEIIAVDDCSTDASWENLQILSKQDNRLKVYKNEKNLGAYPTRNKALELATGDYITVHDSDDWSHPQMIQVQMEAMQENPRLKITCSAMARVYPNLRFILRPQRENLQYIHRSYPSILIKRKDLDQLGEWDSVSANADDELVQRARVLWGNESILDIMKDVPLSYFLVHENSLTQQKGTSLNTITFGIRKEYTRQATYWYQSKKSKSDLKVKRTSLKHPFPIPQGLAPKNWPKNTHYDLVLVSDLSLLGGTRRCNEGYIEAASKMGWRIGIFHWPRYDLKTVDIAKEYMELSYRDNIDFLVPQDNITADAIIIHHPPILNYEIDAVPKIKSKKVGILVNQSPMQLWTQEPFYYHAQKAEDLVEKLFGHRPIWIPISPRVIQTLSLAGGYNNNIHSSIWYPPYNGEIPDKIPDVPKGFGTKRKIILGRHARDHWTKWPEKPEDIEYAYCANSQKINLHLLGGAQTPEKILGRIPENWNVLEFDSISVKNFLDKLDFFIHYTHFDYIEEFGRNIMEAMVAGRVSILPPDYEDVFGDAAIYAKPDEVEGIVIKYWKNESLYREKIIKGFNFAKRFCFAAVIQENLKRF